jgi:hypothetical protein
MSSARFSPSPASRAGSSPDKVTVAVTEAGLSRLLSVKKPVFQLAR